MKCSEDQKVLFSTLMFQKEAEYWWEIVSKNAEATREEITWKFLVDKFTEKYILRIARDKLAMEFQKL